MTLPYRSVNCGAPYVDEVNLLDSRLLTVLRQRASAGFCPNPHVAVTVCTPHSANRGILYVDEVNLLDDGLVDVVLDSAASGVNTVEREGISIIHPARFIMIGSGAARTFAHVMVWGDVLCAVGRFLIGSGAGRCTVHSFHYSLMYRYSASACQFCREIEVSE